MQPAQDGLHDPFVSRLGSADEIVVGQIEFSGNLLPERSHFVAVRLGTFAGAECGLLHLLPVLIQASQKKNIVAQAAVGAGDDIGNDLFVGVAEMRLAVDVVNRCRDVKPFSHARPTVEDAGPVGNCGDAARRAQNSWSYSRARSTPARRPARPGAR